MQNHTRWTKGEDQGLVQALEKAKQDWAPAQDGERFWTVVTRYAALPTRGEQACRNRATHLRLQGPGSSGGKALGHEPVRKPRSNKEPVVSAQPEGYPATIDDDDPEPCIKDALAQVIQAQVYLEQVKVNVLARRQKEWHDAQKDPRLVRAENELELARQAVILATERERLLQARLESIQAQIEHPYQMGIDMASTVSKDDLCVTISPLPALADPDPIPTPPSPVEEPAPEPVIAAIENSLAEDGEEGTTDLEFQDLDSAKLFAESLLAKARSLGLEGEVRVYGLEDPHPLLWTERA